MLIAVKFLCSLTMLFKFRFLLLYAVLLPFLVSLFWVAFLE